MWSGFQQWPRKKELKNERIEKHTDTNRTGLGSETSITPWTNFSWGIDNFVLDLNESSIRGSRGDFLVISRESNSKIFFSSSNNVSLSQIIVDVISFDNSMMNDIFIFMWWPNVSVNSVREWILRPIKSKKGIHNTFEKKKVLSKKLFSRAFEMKIKLKAYQVCKGCCWLLLKTVR